MSRGRAVNNREPRVAAGTDLPDTLDAARIQTFADLLTVLHAVRYTGALTLHFFSGTANSAELPRPSTRLQFRSPAKSTPAAPRPLDNPDRSAETLD